MAEEEVTYTSVTFNTKKHSQSEVKKEETTYDEVKIKDKTTGQTPDTNDMTSDKSISRCHHYQQLACCLGILCVMLVLGIIAVTVYHLTGENQKLKMKCEELETEKKNLTEQIRDMKTSWNALNVSRAQWSIDAYCPKDDKNNRRCKTCQKGWEYVEPNCYATNDANSDDWKTWEEAQENCTGKISDLVVVINEGEKKTVSEKSWENDENKGYWIGLRVEDGRWKWLDGRNLTYSSWIDQPSDGRCAISVPNQGFKSVSCNERNRWICKKKAVSV